MGVIGGKHWLFVKVETDEGIHGWGEAYTQLDRERNIEQQIHELGQYVIGRDPFNIKHFVNFEETGKGVAVKPFQVEDGYITLPTGPGLGLELDEKDLVKRPFQAYPKRTLREYHQEGP